MAVAAEIQVRDKIYIGGEWVDPAGKETIDVVNASTEEVASAESSWAPERGAGAVVFSALSLVCVSNHGARRAGSAAGPACAWTAAPGGSRISMRARRSASRPRCRS